MSHFWENRNYFFFGWTTLNFRGRWKLKKKKINKEARDICEGTPDIDFERDRSIGLGSTVCSATDRHTHTHTHTNHRYSIDLLLEKKDYLIQVKKLLFLFLSTQSPIPAEILSNFFLSNILNQSISWYGPNPPQE